MLTYLNQTSSCGPEFGQFLKLIGWHINLKYKSTLGLSCLALCSGIIIVTYMYLEALFDHLHDEMLSTNGAFSVFFLMHMYAPGPARERSQFPPLVYRRRVPWVHPMSFPFLREYAWVSSLKLHYSYWLYCQQKKSKASERQTWSWSLSCSRHI